jgi:hypothetical protein
MSSVNDYYRGLRDAYKNIIILYNLDKTIKTKDIIALCVERAKDIQDMFDGEANVPKPSIS